MVPENLRETSSFSIADIEDILSELQMLEEKENTKEPIKLTKSGKLARPVTYLVKPKQPALWEYEPSDLKELLFEMNFLEGNELLKRGDRAGAIDHFREAVGYAPREAKYYLKLAQVLGEDEGTIEEAKQLLNQFVELEPHNMEVRLLLFDLQTQQSKAKRLPVTLKKETKPLKDTKSQVSPASSAQNGSQQSVASSGDGSSALKA